MFPALSRLERSSSIYRHGGRRWGWVWSRRLSQRSWRPSSQHRTRVLNKLVIIRSAAVAAVTVKMEFQPISLFWGKDRGGKWCKESVEAVNKPVWKENLTCFLTENERRGALKASQQHIKYSWLLSSVKYEVRGKGKLSCIFLFWAEGSVLMCPVRRGTWTTIAKWGQCIAMAP